MDYYIFIINDIGKTNVKEITDTLFNLETWAFNYNASNISKLSQGDKVILYLAGKVHKIFYASFEIASSLNRNSHTLFGHQVLDDLFPLSCKINNIRIFKYPVPAKDVKDKLNFIVNKKYWGLAFRQATKKIEQIDYELIIKHGMTEGL